jgi:hypothetical protein
MKFVIAGFGKFGHIAVERLREAFPSPEIVVIDDNKLSLSQAPGGVDTIAGDAKSLLELVEIAPDDVIIPMVPLNLAAAMISNGSRRPALPAGLEVGLPNARFVNESNLICSVSDYLCPDNCPQGDFCCVTGKFRDPLYGKLEQLTAGGKKVNVLRSFQIVPGVGGYTGQDFANLRDGLEPGVNYVATSCKCHAIITAVWVN